MEKLNIVFEMNSWNYVDRSDSAVGKSLVKSGDIDNCKYSGYGIGFDMKGTFSFPTGRFSENVIIFGVDMTSSAHVDNKKKDISTLREGLTQGLSDTTLTAEKKYSNNFTESRKNIV